MLVEKTHGPSQSGLSEKHVDLSRIRLWEKAALRPGDSAPFVWPGRRAHGTAPSEKQRRLEMDRSRREYRRGRAATARGLLFSAFLFVPVGGAFALSGPLAGSGIEQGECQALGSALGPAHQRRLREYRASHGLTAGQESALRLKVCDSGLLRMMPSLAAMIASAEDFEEMAKRLEGMDGEVNTMSLVKLFMSGDGSPR